MKISRSLKRLRTEKGITQEQLAEKLCISRQAVSSWENDRTQPDIEMLGRLSEIFEVSVEELIYGQKSNVSIETEKPNYNNTLIIVFSILGALLAGTGLVLIFVTFWQKMPMLFKAVLSFLPILAGQSAGVFVFLRKRDKLHWREGAGILWSAGIAATLAMIYTIFRLGIYWQTLLIIVSLCIIPVILLLGAVSPVAAFYGCTIAWYMNAVTEDNLFLTSIITVMLISLGCIFTDRLTKKEQKSVRSLYSHWCSIIAIATLFCITGTALCGDLVSLISVFGAVGLCLLLVSLKEPDIAMPYRLPGLLLTSLMLFGSGALYMGNLETETPNLILTATIILSVFISLIYTAANRKKVKDKTLFPYITVSFTALIVYSLGLYFMPDRVSESQSDEIFITIMKIIAIICNILLMISGSKEKKLLPINMGFISVAALTFLIVYQSDLSMIANGILLLLFGAALLTINFRLTRQKKKDSAPESTREVADDE